MKQDPMKRLLRGLAATALLGFAAIAGAAQPAPALPGDSIYQLPLPLTDSNGQTVPVEIERTFVPPDKLRIDATLAKRAKVEVGVDGKKGWMSAPGQNVLPAPVTTMQRTSGSSTQPASSP